MTLFNIYFICKREPNKLDIVGFSNLRLYYGTTGSPKGRKVPGDGVAIVAVQSCLNTNTVMGVEREVLQPYFPPINKFLVALPGMKKLEALGDLSNGFPLTHNGKVQV